MNDYDAIQIKEVVKLMKELGLKRLKVGGTEYELK